MKAVVTGELVLRPRTPPIRDSCSPELREDAGERRGSSLASKHRWRRPRVDRFRENILDDGFVL